MKYLLALVLGATLLAGCSSAPASEARSTEPTTASVPAQAAPTNPKAVIEAWAQAVIANEYPVAKALMRSSPEAWETLMRGTATAAPFTAYRLLEGPTITGQATTALIEWTRAAAPESQRIRCMAVTVDQAGKLDAQSWTICPSAMPDAVDN